MLAFELLAADFLGYLLKITLLDIIYFNIVLVISKEERA
jgi:hypothetical protein